ncbi:hypothetical protein ABIB68_003797 [Bradyrhizobium sp. F1.2.2]
MYDAALASSPGEGRMYFGDGCIQLANARS